MSTDPAYIAAVRDRLIRYAQENALHPGALISISNDVVDLLADHARLTEEVRRLKGERDDLKNERAAGWRDALSCIQYCQANWLQDCKSTASKDALNDAVKMLVDELCSSEPSDWLNTEWKSAQYWMDRVSAAEAENARMKEAVELATSQLELSTYTLAEAARREEAYSARLEAAEAREQEAVRALEKANTPDMFWDAEDPEAGYVDECELVERYSPGEIVRIQCAKSLPDMYGVYVGDWKYTFGTLEECEAAVASASVVKGEKP